MIRRVAVIAVMLLLGFGCATESERARPFEARLVQLGDYDQARQRLRRFAVDEDSPEFILDNLRLAVAALHAGAFLEAEQALRRAYPYLVAGTVNAEDRQNAAVFKFEGELVWKGEPFEQAMAWYYQSLVQMMKGDWENARAAAKNMLFTLVDFAGADTVDQAMRKAESPEWFDKNASEVESDLVLGWVMLGVAERWQYRPEDAEIAFNQVRELRPDLAPLVEVLERGDYNTLVFVEAEAGPFKSPVGEREESFRYLPEPERRPASLRVESLGAASIDLPEKLLLVDTWRLAQHPRWWSLRSLRETKKAVGDALTLGGFGAVIIGSSMDDDNARDKVVGAGIAALLAGALLSSSAKADLRHLDVLPRSVYLAPLKLPENGPNAVRFSIDSPALAATRRYLAPGEGGPAVYVVRLERAGVRALDGSIDTGAIAHPNEVTGPIVGTYPYILGGTCVHPPTAEALAAYQAGGYLKDFTLAELEELYRAEGIRDAPPPPAPGTAPRYRHVLDGGLWLYTPSPGSKGFERLTFSPAPPYEPRSNLVRDARRRARGDLSDDENPPGP
ncbi:MAG: hypothetical protein ACF8PN_08870 [Phycisphaerales bacterium]